MGELLSRQKDLERVNTREAQEQMKSMNEMKQRVEQASRALEKMASENVGLRKQVQNMERQKNEMESEQAKKLIESLQEFRDKEAKLKAKCKKY